MNDYVKGTLSLIGFALILSTPIGMGILIMGLYIFIYGGLAIGVLGVICGIYEWFINQTIKEIERRNDCE